MLELEKVAHLINTYSIHELQVRECFFFWAFIIIESQLLLCEDELSDNHLLLDAVFQVSQ